MERQTQYIQQLRGAGPSSGNPERYPETFNYQNVPYDYSYNYKIGSFTPPNHNEMAQRGEWSMFMNQFIALRLENSNLKENYQQEKSKRIEAEINAAKDRENIRRLEKNLEVIISIYFYVI